MQSLSDKIIRNTFFNTMGRFWKIIVSLFLSPYIVGHLGVERYGLWAIVSVLTTYFSFLDMGVGTGFTKFVAEYFAKRDNEKINQVINTGLFFYCFSGLLVLLAGLLSAEWLLSFFNISDEFYEEALFVVRIGFLNYVLLTSFRVFTDAFSGLQRMDITNKIHIGVTIPSVFGIIFSLERGYGLKGLLINELFISILTTAITVIILFRILPVMKIRLSSINRLMFKTLFHYGINIQANRLGSTINFQLDKFILAHFLDFSSVAFYHLGSRIAYILRSFPEMMLSAVIPAASELHAEQKTEKIYQLFLRSSKYLVLLTIPLTAFFVMNAHLVMNAWMGRGFEKSAWVLQILSIGFFANISLGAAAPIILGMGRPEIQRNTALLSTILNLTFSVLLVKKYGFLGAPIGTSLAMIIAILYFVTTFHKIVRKSLFEYAKKIFLLPAIALLVSSLISVIMKHFWISFFIPSDRLSSLLSLAIHGIILVSVYCTVILLTNYIDAYDRNLAIRYLPFFERFLSYQPHGS